MSPTRLLAALFALVLILMVGCGPPLPEHQTDSRWFRYWHEPDAAPSAAQLELLDRFVDQLLALDSLSLPPGTRFDYFLVAPSIIDAYCPAHAGACAVGGHTIYSPTPVHLHEVVHVVLAHHGRPPLFLVEGMAEVLSCENERGFTRWQSRRQDQSAGAWPPIDRVGRVRGALGARHYEQLHARHDPKTNAEVYDPLMAFTGALIDRLGLPAVLELYRTLPPTTSLAALDRQLQEEHGVALDTLIVDAEQGHGEHTCWAPANPCDDAYALGDVDGIGEGGFLVVDPGEDPALLEARVVGGQALVVVAECGEGARHGFELPIGSTADSSPIARALVPLPTDRRAVFRVLADDKHPPERLDVEVLRPAQGSCGVLVDVAAADLPVHVERGLSQSRPLAINVLPSDPAPILVRLQLDDDLPAATATGPNGLSHCEAACPEGVLFGAVPDCPLAAGAPRWVATHRSSEIVRVE